MWCFFRLSQSFKSFGCLAFWLCCRRSTADPPGSRSSIRKIKGATKGRTHWKLTGYCSRKQQRQQQLISPYNNETVTPLTSSMECSFSSAFSSAGIAAVVSPKCHECHDVSSLQRSDPPLTSIVAFGINCRAQEWCNLARGGRKYVKHLEKTPLMREMKMLPTWWQKKWMSTFDYTYYY